MGAIQPQLGPDGAAPGLDVFNEGFINPAEVLTTAWDVAGATDALAHMAYDEVLGFSRLYAHQRRYEDGAREGGRVIYGQLIERGANGVAANYRNLYALISSTWFLENGLLEEYGRVLADVDSAAG